MSSATRRWPGADGLGPGVAGGAVRGAYRAGRVPSPPAAKPGRFDLADLLRFAKVVGGGAAPRTYKVKKGDTLSGIAGKKLGDAGRWPEIARLNRDIVPDPDELFPGQVLVILER
jgi:nucleoid-associated protein YgaU